MKKCFLYIFAAVFSTACTSRISNEITTEITGNIENFAGNIRIVDDTGKNLADINTVDGRFKISYSDTATAVASIYLNDTSYSYFFLEGGSIAIQGNYLQKGTTLNISGTPSNDANMEMMKNLAPVFEKMYSVPEGDKDSLAAAWDEYQQVVKDIYNKYKGKNLMAIKLLNDQLRFSMEPEEMLEDLSGYPEIYRNNNLLQFLKRHAENILKTSVGQPYIEITQPSPDGSVIKLGNVIEKNRYTLVDFWASWCGPCMAEIPLLVELYEKFHDKGFEIYGVSLDSKKEN